MARATKDYVLRLVLLEHQAQPWSGLQEQSPCFDLEWVYFALVVSKFLASFSHFHILDFVDVEWKRRFHLWAIPFSVQLRYWLAVDRCCHCFEMVLGSLLLSMENWEWPILITVLFGRRMHLSRSSSTCWELFLELELRCFRIFQAPICWIRRLTLWNSFRNIEDRFPSILGHESSCKIFCDPMAQLAAWVISMMEIGMSLLTSWGPHLFFYWSPMNFGSRRQRPPLEFQAIRCECFVAICSNSWCFRRCAWPVF